MAKKQDNPMVMLLGKSVNSTDGSGFIPHTKSYAHAKALLLTGKRGHHKLDPKDKNYIWNGIDLIKQSTSS